MSVIALYLSDGGLKGRVMDGMVYNIDLSVYTDEERAEATTRYSAHQKYLESKDPTGFTVERVIKGRFIAYHILHNGKSFSTFNRKESVMIADAFMFCNSIKTKENYEFYAEIVRQYHKAARDCPERSSTMQVVAYFDLKVRAAAGAANLGINTSKPIVDAGLSDSEALDVRRARHIPAPKPNVIAKPIISQPPLEGIISAGATSTMSDQ